MIVISLPGIDYCASPSPCFNGATCTNANNGFTCICANGYTDNQCQTGTHTYKQRRLTPTKTIIYPDHNYHKTNIWLVYVLSASTDNT